MHVGKIDISQAISHI